MSEDLTPRYTTKRLRDEIAAVHALHERKVKHICDLLKIGVMINDWETIKTAIEFIREEYNESKRI